MPNRSFASESYRYGFNSHEKDDEIKSITGSSYDFGARIYDPRLGRFLSTDPWERKYAWQTPFAYFANSPISKVDWNGFGDGDDKSPVESPTPNSQGSDVKQNDNSQTNPFKTGQGRFGTNVTIPSTGGTFKQGQTSVNYQKPTYTKYMPGILGVNRIEKVNETTREVNYGYDDNGTKFSIETITYQTEIKINETGAVSTEQTKTYQLEVYEVHQNKNKYNGLEWNSLGKRIMNSKTTTKIKKPTSISVRERVNASLVYNRKMNEKIQIEYDNQHLNNSQEIFQDMIEIDARTPGHTSPYQYQ